MRKIGLLLFVVAAIVLCGVAIKSKSGGNNGVTMFGSSYSAEYKVTTMSTISAGISVTVKGPAARLAVVLTDPKGESIVQAIEKDAMMANVATVEVPIQDTLNEGAYVLAVKTTDPEKVVWKKEIPLSMGNLTVEDVKLNLAPVNENDLSQGRYVKAMEIVLKKDGEMPVTFVDADAMIDGTARCQLVLGANRVMFDQQYTLGVDADCRPTTEMQNWDRTHIGLPRLYAVFRPDGRQHVVRGKLFLDDQQKKYVEFSKEFTVPTAAAQVASSSQ
ncbi:MAG: hypothetical protein NT155_00105 [Candidatus Staskawiczbacteria bacterium]|nr:hypothetical protein [Candidatus Staskawiczbacteria bacterium]